MDEVCTEEVCTFEVCTDEACIEEVCTIEACTSEVCTSEVCLDEVNYYTWIVLSPLIPNINPLIENRQLLFVSHDHAPHLLYL